MAYRRTYNLDNQAALRAANAGLNYRNAHLAICAEPQRQNRIPRDVYSEMLDWTPAQWWQGAREIGNERLWKDYEEDRECQTFPV